MNVNNSLRNLRRAAEVLGTTSLFVGNRDQNRPTVGYAATKSAKLAFTVCLLVAIATSVAQATVLTFQVTHTPPDTDEFMSVLAAYGDNVNSTIQTPGAQVFNYLQGNAFTPNIVVAYDRDLVGNYYFSHDDDGFWPTGVAYLQDFNGIPNDRFWFTFTPDPNLGVSVNSFVLRGYNGNNMNATWELRQSSVAGPVLDSGTVTGVSLANITPVTNAFFGSLVLVVMDNANSNILGVDNINFDQVYPVPEPATLALLGLGIVGMAVRSRRRRVAA